MSKQGSSRSRAEKSRGAVSVVVPISNDIVPGKYTENDLNMAIEQENTDEFIFSLIDSILQETESQINEKYLKSRIVPFTVNLAKNAMLKIVEWNFLCHDKGESDKYENVWLEDYEPESCMIDSWAQGYFPKRQYSFEIAHNPTEITEFIPEEVNKFDESDDDKNEYIQKWYSEIVDIDTNNFSRNEAEEVSQNETGSLADSLNCTTDSIKNKTDKPKKSRIPFKPYRGKLNFDDLNMLTETLSETEQRLKLEQNKKDAKLLRAASSRSTTSRQADHVDYEKKVINKLFGTTVKNCNQMRSSDILLHTNEQLLTLMKIPGDQLNIQRVKANHKTVDIGLNRTNLAANKENDLKKKKMFVDKFNVSHVRQDDFRTPVTQNERHPLPVSMLDSIDPVPGVMVQEGDRIKKSTNKKTDREKQMEKEFLSLRPVKNQQAKTSYMIQDIININNVNIKPIITSTPIPPIPEGFKICD